MRNLLISSKKNAIASLIFLGVMTVCYLLFVVFPVENARIYCIYSVYFAFLYSLHVLFANKKEWLITAGMFFTAIADSLLGFPPSKGEAGVFAFLIVQTFYFAYFVTKYHLKPIHIVTRAVLSVVLGIVPIFVLKENANLLAVLAIVYIVNLLHNLLSSLLIKEERLFSLGLLLFILCDLTLGLSMMDGFLDVSGSPFISAISRINCWYFYIPSQVIIPMLPLLKKNEKTEC